MTLTSANLTDLAASVNTLTQSVRDGPSVAISTSTLDSVRLAVYAITGWLVVFAVGCLFAGLYLMNASRRRVTVVSD